MLILVLSWNQKMYLYFLIFRNVHSILLEVFQITLQLIHFNLFFTILFGGWGRNVPLYLMTEGEIQRCIINISNILKLIIVRKYWKANLFHSMLKCQKEIKECQYIDVSCVPRQQAVKTNSESTNSW